MLRRQQINDRLPAGLPEGTEIAHKTGNLPGLAHDASVIYTRTGPRVVVVLTSDYDQYDDVVTLNETIGALTYAAKLDSFTARREISLRRWRSRAAASPVAGRRPASLRPCRPR